MYFEPKMVAANDGDVIFSRSHAVSAQFGRLRYTVDTFVNNHIKGVSFPRAGGAIFVFVFRSIRHVRGASCAHMRENKRENDEKCKFFRRSNIISTSRS
jgi:hypothetical protein